MKKRFLIAGLLIAIGAGTIAFAAKSESGTTGPTRFEQLVGERVTVVYDNPKPADTINRTSNVQRGVTAENSVGGRFVDYDRSGPGWMVIDIEGVPRPGVDRDLTYGRVFIPIDRVITVTLR